MSKPRKPVKKTTATKKVTVKKPAVKKIAARKASAKKPMVKKVMVKKIVKKIIMKRPVEKTGGTLVRPSTRGNNPWNLPDDVANLFVAFFEDNGKVGKKFSEAVRSLSDRSASEIMQSLDWDSDMGKRSVAYLKEKLKLSEMDIKKVKSGKPVNQFKFKELLAGSVFKRNPLTDAEIERIVDELMERLFECCNCCRCWPCRPWRFCKCCFKFKHLVEVAPIPSLGAGYKHVHRLEFPAAAITTSGLTATINNGAPGAGGPWYNQAQVDGLLAAHKVAGCTDHDGRYHTEAEVDTKFNNHKANACADHDGHTDGRYYQQSQVNGMYVADTGAVGDAQGTMLPDARFYTKKHVDDTFTEQGEFVADTGAAGNIQGTKTPDTRFYTKKSLDDNFTKNNVFVADTGAAGDTQGTKTPDTRFFTKKSVNDLFVADTGAAGDTQGTKTPDARFFTKRSVSNMFVADTGAAGNIQGTQTPDSRFFTKRYLAGNLKTVNDLTAPNVKNDGTGAPDPTLGFDITITFPNAVVASPQVMIWGYWVGASVGYSIKKITVTPTVAGNTLTLNCMVYDLSNVLYDKGVIGGNWASRILYLNFVVINM